MPISPEFLPSELHYIIPLAEQHGMYSRIAEYDRRLQRHVQYAEKLLEADIATLRELYIEIRGNGHGPLINEWYHDQREKGTCPADTTWPIKGLLFLFDQLGRLGVVPFNDGAVGPRPARPGRRMDPAKLPEVLRPFLSLYEKWGDVCNDATRYDLIRKALADPNEMDELKAWHAKLSQIDPSSWEPWLFDGPLSGDENFERQKVYFTDLLLYGELEIDKR